MEIGCHVYRPRDPRKTPLFALLEAHYDAVKLAWEERFEHSYGFWQGSHRIPGLGNEAELFFRGTIENLFDRQSLTNRFHSSCGSQGCINTTIQTANTSRSFAAFDPFTETPVQGTHWDFGSSFGKPTSRFAYQKPRTYGFAVGLRF